MSKPASTKAPTDAAAKVTNVTDSKATIKAAASTPKVTTKAAASTPKVTVTTKAAASTPPANVKHRPRAPSQHYLKRQLQRKHEHLSFDVEGWYPFIKKTTFFTEWVTLSKEEATAMVAYYQQRYNSRKHFTKAHCVLIRKLEKRIDVALQHKRFRRHGVFVRLSSRSPKDGQPLQVKSALAKYEKAFQELKSTADEKNGYGDNPNTQMMALFKSQQPFWCVGSGKEALSLLLTSERVFIDLIRAIACTQTPNDKWSTNVIFRAWNPQLDESYEFRCFVHNGKLTAISQYNHYCVLRHLHPQKKRIQDLIVKFWQSLHPCLPTKTYSSYVVDLAIVGPKKDQVIVVELNPYAISTGPSLFHWTIDKEVLHKGPLQFRLRDKPMDNIKTYVEYLLDEMRSYTKAKPWWYLLDQLEQ